MHKIIYATDLHGNKVLFQKLFAEAAKNKAKAIVYGGDIGPLETSGLKDRIENQKKFLLDFLLPKIKDLKKKKIGFYCIMGNGDFKVNEGILVEADKRGELHYLQMKAAVLGKHKIAGYGFVNLFPFATKDWEKPEFEMVQREGIRTVPVERTTMSEDLAALKMLFDPKKTVYVLHAPPFDSLLDMIYGESHVGSKAIRQFIEETQPRLTLHGHIHESSEVSGSFADRIGRTICLNPGANPYADKARFLLLDLDDLKKIKILEAK